MTRLDQSRASENIWWIISTDMEMSRWIFRDGKLFFVGGGGGEGGWGGRWLGYFLEHEIFFSLLGCARIFKHHKEDLDRRKHSLGFFSRNSLCTIFVSVIFAVHELPSTPSRLSLKRQPSAGKIEERLPSAGKFVKADTFWHLAQVRFCILQLTNWKKMVDFVVSLCFVWTVY